MIIKKTLYVFFLSNSFVFGVLTEKICDAVEAAGKNVMSTSSHVTTELVTER